MTKFTAVSICVRHSCWFSLRPGSWFCSSVFLCHTILDSNEETIKTESYSNIHRVSSYVALFRRTLSQNYEKWLLACVMSVHLPLRTCDGNRLPLDGFLGTLMVFVENLSKRFKFRQNLTRVTVLYLKTYTHLW